MLNMPWLRHRRTLQLFGFAFAPIKREVSGERTMTSREWAGARVWMGVWTIALSCALVNMVSVLVKHG